MKMSKNPFEYQKPTDESVERLSQVRELCKNLYEALLTFKESRERSLAVTKLEEVSMWINKHIVFNEQD